MTSLSSELTNQTDLSSEQDKWLLALKMNTYIACMLTEAFEKVHNKPTTDLLAATKVSKMDES